jgi:hypothetical protein
MQRAARTIEYIDALSTSGFCSRPARLADKGEMMFGFEFLNTKV